MTFFYSGIYSYKWDYPKVYLKKKFLEYLEDTILYSQDSKKLLLKNNKVNKNLEVLAVVNTTRKRFSRWWRNNTDYG